MKNVEKTFLKKKHKKKRGKQKKGPKGVPPRQAQKLIFFIRTVHRNRDEIETRKKSDFEHPTKKKKKKEKRK